jgi:hypothetical protein
MMKKKDAVRCIQVNLHRAKAAAAILQKRFTQQNLEVGFVQEPWTVKDRVAGLASRNGKLIYCTSSERPRAALLLNPNISFFPLTQFITRDLASATIDIPTEKGKQRIVIVSAYFPSEDRNPPPPELVALSSTAQYTTSTSSLDAMQMPITSNGGAVTPMRRVSASVNLL